MAFPATYDFNYYKGDTFEFRIYPKKNDGTVFDLSPFYDSNILYSTNTIDNVTGVAPYEQARFSIATARGSAESATIKCFAIVDVGTNTFVQCAIRPTEGNQLDAGREYVYDVEVRYPAGGPDSPFYEKVITLMTGTITVTDQVTRDPVPGD